MALCYTEIVDIKSELLNPMETPNLLPRGRDRVSSQNFLTNFEFALKNRKFMSALFGVVTVWSAITNPLHTPDPSPYLRSLILGPRVEAVKQINFEGQGESPAILQIEQKYNVEDQLFKNFSQQEKAVFDKKINERLKDYRKHDPERAQRVLDNWESTIDAIVNTYVPFEKRQFWKDVLAALLYIEGSGHPVKDINKPTPKSVAGARGPAQLTEDAFYETADKHPEVYSYNPKTKQLYIDPDNGFTSIRVAYLRLSDLLNVFQNNIGLSLGGYFAGETFVKQRIASANSDLLNAVNLGSEDVLKYNVDFAAALKDIKEAKTARNPVQTKD